MNQSLHGIWQLHINAPLGNAADHAVIELPDALLHILRLFQFVGLPLRLRGPPFHPGGVLRHLRQFFLIMADALLGKLSPKLFLDDAVNLQIRIASDGRSKVTVILTRQPKMPCTLHGVLCLLHAPQRQTADQRLLIRVRNLFEKLLQLLGVDFLPRLLDMVAKISDKRRKLLYFIRVRLLVGSIDKRRLQPEKMLRHRLVGDQHKILNDFCRHISLVRPDLHRMPFVIQENLALRKIKVDGTALMPFPSEKSRQFLHLLKHRDKRLILLPLCLVLILQNLSDGSIRHSAIHPDHGFRDPVIRHLTLFVDRHQAAQSEPVHTLIQ